MCCRSNREATRKFIRDVQTKFGHLDVFVPVYKSLKASGSWTNFILKSPQYKMFWKPGTYTCKNSIRTPKEEREHHRRHDIGIHVYLNKTMAENYSDSNVVIKLYALVSSLRGISKLGHAVFDTVCLTQEEYDRIKSSYV